MHLLGGDLKLDSTLGKGSRFYFSVPFECLTETAELDITQALLPVKDSAKRILLVEDTEDNAMLVISYLKKSAIQVDVAENGAEACHRFKLGKLYDLVLMDLQMPVMDGYDATREIRQWEQQKKRKPTPILALTAHTRKEDVDRSLQVGCNEHLTKPISRKQLLEAVNVWIQTEDGSWVY
ncbi:MAG: response regulator [Magnetococcales bacterium]|nr:response regulator [Magnetococcales bacterium]